MMVLSANSHSSVSALESSEAEQCLNCHEIQVKSFQKTAHAEAGSCFACHGDAHAHLEKNGEPHTIVNPGNLSLKKGNAICTQCHEEKTRDAQDSLKASASEHDRLSCSQCHSPHLTSSGQPMVLDSFDTDLGVNCASCHEMNAEKLWNSQHGQHGISCKDCHTIHKDNTISVEIEEEIERCLFCHPQQDLEFRSPFAHPLREQQIKCSDCHDPHSDRYTSMLKKDGDRVCEDCHADTMIEGGRHPLRQNTDHSLRSVACLECHQAHGSNFEFILKHHPDTICTTCHT